MNENRYFSIAVHEVSHGIVADHYGVWNFPEVTPGGISRLTKQTMPNFGGVCWLSDPVTPYQNCVICFGGLMGEAMYATGPDWLPPFRPSKFLLREWFNCVMQQYHRLSDGDRSGILGYKWRWRACKAAFAILRRNKRRIIRLAKCLSADLANKERTAEEFRESLFKLAHGPKEFSMPVASLIAAIKNHLSNLSPDDPKRPALERAIDCYQKDGKLPDDLKAELEKP